MACTLQSLKGIPQFCDTNLAGIKEAWLGQYGEFTVSEVETAHTVTIAAKEGATDAKLYHYEFAKQTGSLTSNITIDEANGVRYYTHEVSLQFNKMEAAKHVEIEAIAAGKLIGIFADNNGKYWFVGYDGYLSATAATAQSGQSYSDLNGYTTTMSAMSAHLPYAIQYDDFKSLIDGE